MNIIDLRKNLELSPTSQLLYDRRKVPFKFGSPEWLEYMKQNNTGLPIHDRRKISRRSPAIATQQTKVETLDKKCYYRISLTPAERTLLEDLYLIDLD